MLDTKLLSIVTPLTEIMGHLGLEASEHARRNATAGTTAADLMGRLPSFPGATIDEILDLRKALATGTMRFRRTIMECSNDLNILDPDYQHAVENTWRTVVAPAVEEMNEDFRDARILRWLKPGSDNYLMLIASVVGASAPSAVVVVSHCYLEEGIIMSLSKRKVALWPLAATSMFGVAPAPWAAPAAAAPIRKRDRGWSPQAALAPDADDGNRYPKVLSGAPPTDASYSVILPASKTSRSVMKFLVSGGHSWFYVGEIKKATDVPANSVVAVLVGLINKGLAEKCPTGETQWNPNTKRDEPRFQYRLKPEQQQGIGGYLANTEPATRVRRGAVRRTIRAI